jgi:hypothetical protein
MTHSQHRLIPYEERLADVSGMMLLFAQTQAQQIGPAMQPTVGVCGICRMVGATIDGRNLPRALEDCARELGGGFLSASGDPVAMCRAMIASSLRKKSLPVGPLMGIELSLRRSDPMI